MGPHQLIRAVQPMAVASGSVARSQKEVWIGKEGQAPDNLKVAGAPTEARRRNANVHQPDPSNQPGGLMTSIQSCDRAPMTLQVFLLWVRHRLCLWVPSCFPVDTGHARHPSGCASRQGSNLGRSPRLPLTPPVHEPANHAPLKPDQVLQGSPSGYPLSPAGIHPSTGVEEAPLEAWRKHHLRVS